MRPERAQDCHCRAWRGDGDWRSWKRGRQGQPGSARAVQVAAQRHGDALIIQAASRRCAARRDGRCCRRMTRFARGAPSSPMTSRGYSCCQARCRRTSHWSTARVLAFPHGTRSVVVGAKAQDRSMLSVLASADCGAASQILGRNMIRLAPFNDSVCGRPARRDSLGTQSSPNRWWVGQSSCLKMNGESMYSSHE